MNSVTLLGNLGADAELNITSSGQAVLKFSVATTEKYKDKTGETKEDTSWHRCAMWGDRATKLATYLTKGTKVAVQGSIKYGNYEKDGVKHYTTDIKVFNVEFCGGGNRQPEAATSDANADWNA